MTLNDVADDANVALNTARKALQGDPTVRPRLKARVLRSAERLGYRPNLVARGLQEKSLGVVPISVIKLAEPYFGALAQGLSEALVAAGLEPALCTTPDRLIRLAQTLHTCGSILAYEVDADKIRPLIAYQKVVAINAPIVPMPGFAGVQTDFESAYGRAVGAVLETGRRRVGILSRFYAESVGEGWPVHKFATVQQVLREGGIEPVLPSDAAAWERSEDVVELLLERPGALDAVFCEDDLVAARLFGGLTAAGVRVPEDVLIIGCNGQMILPGCWSVEIDTRRVAEEAVSRLRRLLEGEEIRETAVVQCRLVDAACQPI
jgi:LacI family transcriptional regulator